MTKTVITYIDAIITPNTDIIEIQRSNVEEIHGRCMNCLHYTPCKKYFHIFSTEIGCPDWLDGKTPLPEGMEWTETDKGWVFELKNEVDTEVTKVEVDNDDKYLPYYSAHRSICTTCTKRICNQREDKGNIVVSCLNYIEDY